jgi:hypothetical protein
MRLSHSPAGGAGAEGKEMPIEYLKMLLATAEEMLSTVSTLPESASRDDALQMVRAYLSNIALLMNAVDLGLKAQVSRKDDAQ